MGEIRTISGTRRMVRILLIAATLVMVAWNVQFWVGRYTEPTSGIGAGSARETSDLGAWEGNLPLAREIRRTTVSQVKIAVRGSSIDSTIAYFTPKDQSINTLPIYDTLPTAKKETVIRHEFGHALMSDLVNAGGSYSDSRRSAEGIAGLSAFAGSGDLPELLRPIWNDFVDASQNNPNIYLNHGPYDPERGYYVSAFGEFFAESFACYCEGSDEVPESTRRAFEAIEQLPAN
jgi:hypothetical protein